MKELENVDPDSLYSISICAGALGLDLGIELALPGYQTAVMVERETSVAARMAARVEEGSIPALAQWDDVTSFDGCPWRGRIQAITAGFPCQPFSVAGKRGGTSDDRWIWPDIARVIRETFGAADDPEREEALLFLENVPGLLLDPNSDVDRWEMDDAPDDALGGAGTVFRDLAELDFRYETVCIRASDVGAAHGRKRVFILAYRERARCDGRAGPGLCDDGPSLQAARSRDGGGSVEDAGRAGLGRAAQPEGLDGAWPPDHDRRAGGELGDAGDAERWPLDEAGRRSAAGRDGQGEAAGRPRVGNEILEDAPRSGERGSLREARRRRRRGIREADETVEHAARSEGARFEQFGEHVPGPSNFELGDAGGERLPRPEQGTVLEPRRGDEGRTVGQPSELLGAAGDAEAKLADPTRGGLRELRQSSGRGGFPDGRDAALELAGGVDGGGPGLGVGEGLGEASGSPDDEGSEKICGSAPRSNRELGDAHGGRCSGESVSVRSSRPDEAAPDADWSSGEFPIFAPGPADERWADLLVWFPWLRPSLAHAEIESAFRDVADGLAALLAHERTAALRTLGNGVVPLQAAIGFRILMLRMGLMVRR